LHTVTVSRADLNAWKCSSFVPVALDTHTAEDPSDYATVIKLLHAVYVEMIGEKEELIDCVAIA